MLLAIKKCSVIVADVDNYQYVCISLNNLYHLIIIIIYFFFLLFIWELSEILVHKFSYPIGEIQSGYL